MEELEARVAALEASRADYRTVPAAINAHGANQREIATTLADHSGDLADLKGGQADLRTGQRSLEENVAEIKDLLVPALDR